jgi:hypothetical protein
MILPRRNKRVIPGGKSTNGLRENLRPFVLFRSFGNHIPGSKNDFGQDNQYGQLLALTYTATGGGPETLYQDFRQILSKNPCSA